MLPLIRQLRAAVEQAGQAKRTYEAAVANHARLQEQRGDAKGRLDQAMKDAEEVPVLESRIALKRLGTPDDVAYAAVFLASEQAGYITGTVLNVSGGLYT